MDGDNVLFIRKNGPLRGRGEAKKWTRGKRYCPKESNYSERAQQGRGDQHELIEERRK